MAQGYTSEKAKTRRAFDAYMDFLDTAYWLRAEMNRQLGLHDLTIIQFRVLDLLKREGAQYPHAIGRKLLCSHPNIARVVQRMMRLGWVEREDTNLDSSWASANRPAEQRGRRINLVRLTAQGQKLIADVFPNHAKAVRTEFRGLDGREQQTLSRLCRKLREGNPSKTAGGRDPSSA